MSAAPSETATKKYPTPASVAESSCESEALIYAAAYTDYENAVNVLNDAYDALYACQYGGGQQAPAERNNTRFASMKSVVE